VVKPKKNDRRKAKEPVILFDIIIPEVRRISKSIIGLANLAVQDESPSRQKEYLNKIRSLSKSLLTTLTRITEYSRIESGKLKLETEEFDLDSVLKDLSNQVIEEVQEKGIEFILDRRVDVPQCLVGDSLRLEQVLLNFTSNAIKHTDRGIIAVTVELLEKSKGGVVLRFSTKDTGTGLSNGRLSELLAAEQHRAEGEYREEISGLGLRTSKRLIEMMGGELSVESEFGKGSSFVFTATFGLPEKTDLDDSALPSVFKTMRVLVVDDNKTMQMVMKLMLESLDFYVTTVSSGAEAIEELVRSDTQNPYELVLMDWMMPGMDGLEASRRIVKHPKLTWHPVIVMVSAYSRSSLKLEAAQIGIEGFLEKPVSQALLKSTIMDLFGLKTLSS